MSDWLRSMPVAHRGLHEAGAPENSGAAFARAMAAGYAIELDLRLARDGVAVVFHDATLDRLCGRAGRIAELDSAALPPLIGGERIPTLASVLDQVAGRVPLLIELKTAHERIGPLEAAVAQQLGAYRGAFAVQSFNPRTVAWFARHAPAFLRGQIAERTRKVALRLLLALRHGAPHFLAYNVAHLPAALPRAYRARGLPVLAWTVRTEEARARAAAHADNIIFELPVRPEGQA